jgi:S1-C subfamily serine protease
LLSRNGNFTLGNVTALAGIGDDTRYFQVSAPLQAGNSGGPLLDQSGNLIGVVTAKLDAVKLMAAIGDLPQNVNFAIKANVAQGFLDSNRIKYENGTAEAPLAAADLADQAKAMSVSIDCVPP